MNAVICNAVRTIAAMEGIIQRTEAVPVNDMTPEIRYSAPFQISPKEFFSRSPSTSLRPLAGEHLPIRPDKGEEPCIVTGDLLPDRLADVENVPGHHLYYETVPVYPADAYPSQVIAGGLYLFRGKGKSLQLFQTKIDDHREVNPVAARCDGPYRSSYPGHS